ncbi:MAG: hypothetical protein WD534_15235 [Phycisphaeraceae bacterium]
MANDYLQFSIDVPGLTPAERYWLERQLDADLLQAAAIHQSTCDELHALPGAEREAAYHESRARYLQASPDGIEPRDLVLLGHYRQQEDTLGFESLFERDREGEQILLLFAEEQGDVEPVAVLLKAFLERFRPMQQLALTWACTCSKPRPGAFGGGGVIISAERCVWFDAHQWVQERLAGITSEACRRQLAELRRHALRSVASHLHERPGCQLDLDEADEAVDLAEPGETNEHTPRIIAVQLAADGLQLQATVYHPVDVNEETWDATALHEHLSAEDAARLLAAIERITTADCA